MMVRAGFVLLLLTIFGCEKGTPAGVPEEREGDSGSSVPADTTSAQRSDSAGDTTAARDSETEVEPIDNSDEDTGGFDDTATGNQEDKDTDSASEQQKDADSATDAFDDTAPGTGADEDTASSTVRPGDSDSGTEDTADAALDTETGSMVESVDTGTGTKGEAGASCESNLNCVTGTTCRNNVCVPGGECGATEFDITRVQPNLIIILDRSCSMGPSRWNPAVSTVNSLVTRYEDDIRFGLALFPDNLGTGPGEWERSCAMDSSGAITVPVAPGNTAAITQIMNDSLIDGNLNHPGEGACQTPTYNAIAQSALDPATKDTDRHTYFLLITDGEATCQNPRVGGDIAAINELLSDLFVTHDIPTFVVGFGNTVVVEDLRSHAVAAGTVTTDETGYYQADSPEILLDTIEQITDTLVSCEYFLGESAPEGEKIYVFFNDEEQIAQDSTHQEGWDFDAATNTVQFFGEACDIIQNSDQSLDIDIVFGCPAPVLLE